MFASGQPSNVGENRPFRQESIAMQHAATNLEAGKSACQLLDTLWCDRGFPVDAVWIAEELGVTVLETELPDNVQSGLLKDADKDPVILLNQVDTQDHKRIICARKIGHYVDLTLHDQDCYKYVDFRTQQAKSNAGADEVFANDFSASLLMPEQEVRGVAQKAVSLRAMAEHFGVSEDAMQMRLESLGNHRQGEVM
jgi:Zn-dependent peptidase ImmA (M78 family)